jgi:hypothetical protein
MPDPLLVVARAVHYAALVQFAGLFVFLRLVLEPTLRESRTTDTAALHQRFMAIAWGSVILILLSDAALLALEAAEIGDEPLSAVWQSGLDVTVLNQNAFRPELGDLCGACRPCCAPAVGRSALSKAAACRSACRRSN